MAVVATAHADTFARDHLPPREAWPDLSHDIPYPERVNAADALLDPGFAAHPAVHGAEATWTYAELRDTFRALATADDVDAVVVAGEAGNFCSGGDVHDIIGPLTEMDMRGLLRFTRMTGDLVKAIRGCPQPVIAAVARAHEGWIDELMAGFDAAEAEALIDQLGGLAALVEKETQS